MLRNDEINDTLIVSNKFKIYYWDYGYKNRNEIFIYVNGYFLLSIYLDKTENAKFSDFFKQ